MKKFAKVLSLALAVMLMALTLTACGSSGSSGMTKQFTAGSAYFIGDIGWYNSDWSSDVCSSDLAPWARAPMAGRPTGT